MLWALGFETQSQFNVQQVSFGQSLQAPEAGDLCGAYGVHPSGRVRLDVNRTLGVLMVSLSDRKRDKADVGKVVQQFKCSSDFSRLYPQDTLLMSKPCVL